MPIRINGETSGSTIITAPATGTDETIELSTALASKVAYPSGGADGNVLTKSGTDAAWSAAGSVGGLVRIASESPSAVSSLAIDGIFTSSYENYLMVFYWSTTTGQDLFYQFRSGGSTQTAGNYQRQLLSAVSTTLTGVRQNNQVHGVIAYTDTNQGSGTTTITQPNLAGVTTIRTEYMGQLANGSTRYGTEAGGYAANASFDGINLFVTSGTFTGTFRIYGYRN